MAKLGNMNIKITRDSSDHKGMPLEIEVEYYGVKHIISGNDIKSALELYLLSERKNMTAEQAIEHVRATDGVMQQQVQQTQPVQQVQRPVQQTQQVQTTNNTQQTTVRRNEEVVEENNSRIKVTGVGKKLLALLTAGVILVIGHFGGSAIYRALKNKGEGDREVENPQVTPIYEQVTPEIIYTTPEPVYVTPEVIYTTPEPVYVTPEPITGDNVIAPPVSIPGSENLPYINRSSSDWIAMSDAEYLEALNSQTIACQMNMPEISLFLEGEPLEGTKQITNIQKTFKPGSVDYCIVEYFNQFRNEVVNAAYDTHNIDNTRTILVRHVTEMYLFCTNQKKITLNTNDGVHEYYWSDLSYEARNAVLDVMFAFVIAMPHDYSVTINGVEMYPYNISDFYEGQLATLTLVNPTNSK